MAARLKNPLIVVILSAMLASCGFHLRDSSYRLPDSWKNVEVEVRGSVSNKSALTLELKKILSEAHGVGSKSTRKDNHPKIILLDEKFRSPVTVLDSLGRAQEYLLEYIVRVQFVDSKGKALAPVHRIYLRREQSYSSTSILAKERESEQLNKVLQQRAATRVIGKLLSMLR